MVASIYGFDLATEVGFLQSCQPRRVWWSLSCTRGLWKTEREGPDDDSMIFLGELGAVTVERPEVPACGLLSRVLGVASPSRTTFSPEGVSLELEAALPVGSQSQHHHPLAFSMLMDFRGSLSSMLVTCLGEQLLSLRMMSSCDNWTVAHRRGTLSCRISGSA